MYAGFWNRLAASLLDLLVLLIPIIVVPVVVALITGPKSQATTIADLSIPVMLWLYFAGMESSPKGATLGKIAFGIRVVDLEGNRLGFMRASARLIAKALSALPFGIGFLMAGLTPRKQALHDIVTGCVVVKRDALPSRVRSPIRSPARREPVASGAPAVREGIR